MKKLKIAIIYPPITKQGAYPLLTQNRQFKYSKSNEIRIYPVVSSSLATMLKNSGHHILFLDGINLRMSMVEFNNKIQDFDPNIIFMETKSTIIKSHWKYIDEIKKHTNSVFVLFGDHVSFFPEESIRNSKVDYVITGGDYDFIGSELVDYIANSFKKKLPGGVMDRKMSYALEKEYSLDELPFIDRELTHWKIYGEAYLNHPVAYIMTGRGCGGINGKPGVCSFCVWQHSLWHCKARLRKPEDVVREIHELYNKYHIVEIFDDNEAGAIWNKEWLENFCFYIDKYDLRNKFFISTNARADSLDEERCELMRDYNFRLLKVGLESANNFTLKRLNKMETIENIVKGVKTAKRYGLRVLLTTMVGYPWESKEDMEKTYRITKELMLYKTHFGDSLQSSVIIPYPGTPLYKVAIKNNWLTIDPYDYEKIDMTMPILKTNIDTTSFVRRMWRIHLHPIFLLKSLFSLRKLSNLKLALRGIISLIGHLRDY